MKRISESYLGPTKEIIPDAARRALRLSFGTAGLSLEPGSQPKPTGPKEKRRSRGKLERRFSGLYDVVDRPDFRKPMGPETGPSLIKTVGQYFKPRNIPREHWHRLLGMTRNQFTALSGNKSYEARLAKRLIILYLEVCVRYGILPKYPEKPKTWTRGGVVTVPYIRFDTL
jgi:hypothetical protein